MVNREAWVGRAYFDCHAMFGMRYVGTKTNETYLDTSSLSCEFPCLSLSNSSSKRWERLLKWQISSESSPEKNPKPFRCTTRFVLESEVC